jgi:phosphate-selective porin OprO/OprP
VAAWLCAALVFAAVAAGAAEVEGEDAAGAESPEPEKHFFFDLGWDDGPTYALGELFPRFESLAWAEPAYQVELRGRVGGSLSLDGGTLGGDALPDGPRIDVRKARLYTRGNAYWLVHTEFKVEFAFEDQQFFLNDFYLRWKPRRFVDSVRFGYFDPPVSLQALTGSADRSLLESPPPVSAFAPGYRLGAEASGRFERPSLTWALNVSSVGQSQPNAEASSSSVLRGVGRLAWRPLGDDVTRPALIHLGVSGSHVLSGSGDLQYRARPDTFLTPYLVDTASFDANATLLGLEAAFRNGPATLQAEYLRSFVDADEGGSLDFSGAYAELSLVVTGETRPYDVATAVFTRIEPRAPFKPFRGQWGALELTGRLSWIDLDNGPVEGGRMIDVAVGPTWTWNKFVRFLASYSYARIVEEAGGDDAHVAQARIELRL